MAGTDGLIEVILPEEVRERNVAETKLALQHLKRMPHGRHRFATDLRAVGRFKTAMRNRKF